MSLFFASGSPDDELSPDEVREGLASVLSRYSARERVLAIPPDATRLHSRAGEITEMLWQMLSGRLVDVLPALGTHRAMKPREIGGMFGKTPLDLFRIHDWRKDVVTLGEVPGSFVHDVSEGRLSYGWPAQVNRLLRDGNHDLIFSIGQVVPHEVAGMANGSKNIFIGTGGPVSIHRSHFLGAVYGMERMMGRTVTPVRQILDYASEHFGTALPQIVYVQTVVAKNHAGDLVLRGLFLGDDEECFRRAAALSLACNVEMLDREIRKAVVYLNPEEFRSTWLGNKSIYRTRMALADEAEVIVLAPGVREFGEDRRIDQLIRRYGYRGTTATLEAVQHDAELADNLSAAAHLIHGSSEGRFTVTYCPGSLTAAEIRGVGYQYGSIGTYMARYDPDRLKDGWNTVGGEEIFYVSNPALGLWASRDRFERTARAGAN